jgi:hypothetical protein
MLQPGSNGGSIDELRNQATNIAVDEAGNDLQND